MKKEIIFIAFLTLNLSNLRAQEIQISEVSNSVEIDLIHSIREIYRFNSDQPRLTSILLLESGYITNKEVRGMEGMDVICHKLFISIRQLTESEQTSQNAYWIDGNFYNPRNYEYNGPTQSLTFDYGTEGNTVTVTLKVTPNSIQYK
ncbi:MAG: hypothetical protein ABJG99_17785 [Crocinitomicaceae bacterium]